MFDKKHLKVVNNVKASQSRIDEFVKKIRVDLPKDYQSFLLDYNGVTFENLPSFYVPKVDKSVKLYTLYGLDFDNPSGTNLERIYGYNFNYELDGKTLMIGHCFVEDGRLPVLLVQTEDASGIYVCDFDYDDFYFPESTEESNAYKICDSFSEFIALLTFH